MEVLTVTLNPCIDRTLYVDRLKKNGLVRSNEEFSIAGGKGANVARQLVHLGIRASAFIVVGGESGDIYTSLLKRDGINIIPYKVDEETRWQDTFFEKPSGRYFTVLQEPKPVPRRHEKNIIDMILSGIKKQTMLVLSGSTPGNGLNRVYAKVIKSVRDMGVPVILDTYNKALSLGVREKPFMIKPNDKECEEYLGFSLKSDADFRRVFRHFHEKGIEFVVISLGRKGFRASHKGQEYKVIPPRIREVNPVASGDALVAGIVYGILKKMPMVEILKWGCAAGTANAAVWLVANCSKKVIEGYLSAVSVYRI